MRDKNALLCPTA